jgi:hypothetical protein
MQLNARSAFYLDASVFAFTGISQDQLFPCLQQKMPEIPRVKISHQPCARFPQ